MPFYDENINTIIKDDFLEYAGHVMQERSVPDARDALKDGARKILYIQYKDKNIHTKNFIKGAAAVGQAMKMGYLHGDASAYGTLVRMGKRYACPYVFEELQGNVGNQVSPDNHASMRYLELRQSELASYLFTGVEKNAINEWYDNYANTLQLPRVLPTIGIYPIVNGLSGIAVGLSTSYPPTNLIEVNNTIIKLMQNPDLSDQDVYCAPDFPMGGTIINGNEVKTSMLAGSGASVKVQAKIEYIPDKHMLVATEIPFSVYTDTIDNELTELINNDENCGIIKYIDATNDEGARINIYLEKNANVKKVINLLYKSTSLESYYSINLIMLEDGRFPKIYTWKNALQTYITHIRQCKRNEIQFDLDKYLARLNVIEGLIIAAANIDDVVAIIRSSQNPAEASDKLIARYSFNEEQTKAILAMKLSALTKIDGIKLDNEREEVKQNISNCRYLLNDSTALDNELIKILREVADKFGDARRTKIINISEEETSTESVEEKQVGVLVFNNNSIRVVPQEDLPEAKRGRKGAKLKLPKGIELVNTFYTTNLSSIAAFSDQGKMYSFSLADLNLNEDYSLYDIIAVEPRENIILINDATAFYAYKNLVTISKQGLIKKTATKEYNIRNKKGTIAVKLADDDQLVGAHLSMSDDDKIVLAANNNLCVYYSLIEVNATGRATKGVKAMKLAANEYIVSSTLVRANTEYYGVLSITTSGRGKIVPVNELVETSRTSKGHTVMDTKDDTLTLIYAVPADKEKIFISTSKNKCVLININEIPISGRTTCGNLLIDCRDDTSAIRVM